MPELYNDNNLPKKVVGVQFGFGTKSEFTTNATLLVNTEILYTQASNSSSAIDQTPSKNGVLDSRMGISNPKEPCQTCGKRIDECNGHYGVVELSFPCFHVGYLKYIQNVLASVCKQCSRILLPEQARLKYLKSCTRVNITFQQKRILRKKIYEHCRKTVICPHCGSLNGAVGKNNGMQLFHKRYVKRTKADDYPIELAQEKFTEVIQDIESNNQTSSNLGLQKLVDDGKIMEIINPLMAQTIFKNIPDADVPLLCLGGNRPEDMIWTHVPVPPKCIRPSTDAQIRQGTTEDTLTTYLRDMVRYSLFNIFLLFILSGKSEITKKLSSLWLPDLF